MENKGKNNNDGEGQFREKMETEFQPKAYDYDNSNAEGFNLNADEVKNRGIAYEPNGTTGSGYSEAEREAQDGINTPDGDNGSKLLVDKFNVNDKAHSDSSIADFTETTSAFNHNNDEARPKE